MLLIEKIRADQITAMKEKDQDKKLAISSLIDAAKKVVIDKGGDRVNIPDEIVTQVVLKELKTIKEQIDSCPADRTDLLEEYKKRYAYVEAYAPKLMSKEEVISLINDKFADVVASKNKGLIMKTIMPELKGKADGKLINEIVEELCK
ncbi:MAG: GatB/YqeY domain-containing protein [Lachnospiraceae bacterium]|nr:GatB/YqeY domain-containing protein [Lachnospiraceae bacterium]